MFVVGWALLALPVSAQVIWVGGSGGNANDWGRAQNWNPSGVPTATTAVQFDDTANVSNLAPSIAATPQAVGSIAFANGTTNAYNISGTATLTAGSATAAGITNSSATNQTFSVSTLALGFDQTWEVANTGNLIFSGAVSLGTNALTLTGSTAGAGSVSGAIGGSGNITKTGSGTWTFSGTNSYSGITTVNAGTLSVATIGNGGVAGNLGQATSAATNLVLGGGTLQYTGVTASTNRAFTLTDATTSTIDVQSGSANLTISGAGAATTGALTKVGTGTLTLSGANAFTGLTTVSAGTLAYGASNALGSGDVTVNGATAVLAKGAFTDTVGTVTLENGGTISGTTGTLTSLGGTFELKDGTVSAILGGTGIALNKTTSGTVTLSGANTFTGLTTVSAGTLAFGASNVLATGAVTVDGGTAVLDLGANRTDSVGAVTVANGGSIVGTGTSALTGSSVALQDGSVSAILAGAGVVTKSTAGSVTLSGANTYTGGTVVSGGTLQFSGAGTLGSTSGTLTVNSGTLDLSGANLGVGNFTGTGGTVTNNGTAAVLSIGNGNGSGGNFQGVLANGSGTLALSKVGTGTLTLSGANTFTGGTTVSAGTLTLGASDVLSSGAVTVSGGTLALGANSDTVGTVLLTSGNITGTGGVLTTSSWFELQSGSVSAILAGAVNLQKTTAGTVTLTGANTYSGTTNINGGILAINSDARLGDVPGSPTSGELTFDGGTLNVTATTTINANRGITLNSGGGIINPTTGTTTYAGIIEGAGNFAKAGGGALTLSGLNTYTGQTAISGTGALTINSIGNVSGGASALGAPTTVANGTIAFGSGATAGSLTYSGVTASTDRVIDLAGTTGGATLSVNGTGALTFTSNLTTTGDGNKTFSLGGTNTVASTLVGIIPDSATGTTSLVKRDAGTWTLSGANTFTGTTQIQRGILSINSIGNVGGGPSALGAPTTVAAGTIDLGLTTQGGVLTYTGGSTSTNRVINLSGTTGGGTLNANGSGPIVFSSDFTVTGAGIKTLTLGGTNAGLNTISGIIPNGTSSTAVTKTGTGTWLLSGANLYSGNTTLSQGILIVGNDAAFGASTVRFGGGTLQGDGTARTLANPLVFTANSTIGGTSNLTFDGTFDLGTTTRTLTVNNTGTTAMTGVLSNTAGLTKAGAGLLTLSGNSTYTGTTTLSAGTLRATTNATALGAGSLSLGAGTLELVDDTGLNFGRNTTLSANSTIVSDRLTSGATVANTLGTLSIGTRTLNVNAGSNVTGTATTTFLATTVTGNPIFGVGAGSQLVLGALADGGTARTITKTGLGILTLGSGAGSWAAVGDALVVANGTVNFGAVGALGTNTNVTVRSNTASTTAEFDISGFNQTIGLLTFGGTGSTTTSTNLVTTGANTLTLGNNVVFNETGNALGATLSGNLELGGANRTFTIGDSSSTPVELNVSAAIAGAGFGIVKDGIGRLALSNDNGYTGATTINQGAIRVQHANGLGTTAAGTTVAAGAALELSGGISTAAEALALNGTGVGGTGALLGISGANTFGGAVTLGSTSLIAAQAGSSLALSGAIASANHGLAVGTAAHTGSVNFSGTVANGTGTLTKDGAGSLTFAGATTNLGAVTVNAGALNFNGAAATIGQVNLASGSISIGGAATLDTNEITAAAGTTLTVATGGNVAANYAADATFSGSLAGGGTFEKTGGGVLTFNQSFTASNLTLVIGGGTLAFGSGANVTVGTVHITGNTILDFGMSTATSLTSANLLIDEFVTVTVINWISLSDAWIVTDSFYQPGSPNIYGQLYRIGGQPESQITFTDHADLTTAWVASEGGAYFDRELRPVPEPATYGLALLSASLALLGVRRGLQRRRARVYESKPKTALA